MIAFVNCLFIAIKRKTADQLSRRPEGEEFRAAEAGRKNCRRASARRELQDIAVWSRIRLGNKEIARTVKGQAPRKCQAGGENALHAGWSEIDNRVGSRIAKRFNGNVQIAAAVKGEPNGILARREFAWPGKNGARSVRSEFIDRWVPTKIHGALGCVEVTATVESQTPTLTGKGAEHDPVSAGCKLKDGAGFCGT